MQVEIPDELICTFCNAPKGTDPVTAMKCYLSAGPQGAERRVEVLEKWLTRWVKEAILKQSKV